MTPVKMSPFAKTINLFKGQIPSYGLMNQQEGSPFLGQKHMPSRGDLEDEGAILDGELPKKRQLKSGRMLTYD